MEPKLKIENLHVVYDTKEGEVQAVDGLSLELNEKEVIGIAGETGSGKTTLALSILRILPTNGRIVGGKIYFDGADLLSLPEEELLKIRQAKISLIIQQSGKALH
ncbi:MAG: ATP-binding cassette domain-containing protein, partial [Candidatus Njordarchaeum guaymaensis]